MQVFHVKTQAFLGNNKILPRLFKDILMNNALDVINFKQRSIKILPDTLWKHAPYFCDAGVLHYIHKGTCREGFIRGLRDSCNYSMKTVPNSVSSGAVEYERNITLIKLVVVAPLGATKKNLLRSVPKFFRMMQKMIDKDCIANSDKSSERFKREFQFTLYRTHTGACQIKVVYPFQGFSGYNQDFIFHSLFQLFFRSFLWMTSTGTFREPSVVFSMWRKAIKDRSFSRNNSHVKDKTKLFQIGSLVMFTLAAFVGGHRMSLNKSIEKKLIVTGPQSYFRKYPDSIVRVFNRHALWQYLDKYINLSTIHVLLGLPDAFIIGLLKYRKTIDPKRRFTPLERIDQWNS